MDITEDLREYQLSFSEGAVNDLLGSHFGPPGNPNRVLFFIECLVCKECVT